MASATGIAPENSEYPLEKPKFPPCVIACVLTQVKYTSLGLLLSTVPRSAGGPVGAQNVLGLAALRSVVRQMVVVFVV